MQARHRDIAVVYQGVAITVSSNFDSGNLQAATVSNDKLIVMPAFDPMNQQYSTKQSSKTFFHFSITAQESVTVSIVVQRMKILEYFANDEQFQEFYRLCVGKKKKKGWDQVVEYEKIKFQSLKKVVTEGTNSEPGYELHFSINLNKKQTIFLAYHFPYPYEKLQNYIQQIKDKIIDINSNDENSHIYFISQLLIESLQGRAVNLITLTDNTQGVDEAQQRISKSFFPYYEIEGRPRKFNKPYVMFTCRVHPGETSSSYSMQGIIDFLISHDKRATLLRQNFVFLIIPVLNPDGVFHGTYRMDTYGHNLNRFYNSAQSHKQPAIFAVSAVANYYGNRIIFFMDLHSHPHPNKGSFVYGNSLPQIEDQTQSQLYTKLLGLQSECFGYHWCNFSSNQMNSRDVNQLLTKDGSARVQIFKLLNINFAYTMEMGYHGCFTKTKTEQLTHFGKDYQREQKIFQIRDYKEHGKSMLISLLNLYLLNSANGAKHDYGKQVQLIRQQICRDLVQKDERFRMMDSFIFKKIKIINELVSQQYYEPMFKRFSFLQILMHKYLTIFQKKIIVHALSEQIKQEPAKITLPKKQFSLNLKEKSKTIEVTRSKQRTIRSFKSTMEGGDRSSINAYNPISLNNDNFKFAKQLNLNFNPFPSTERKKMYNVIGNRRSPYKKNIINELQFNSNRQIQTMEMFDIDTIDVNSQMQLAERSFVNKGNDQMLRLKVMNNFNFNAVQNQEENRINNDFNQEEESLIQQKFILPKIKASKIEKHFNMEVQLQKEYDKKYQIQDVKDFTPVHHKVTLRNNSLRMRSLIKSMK